MQVTPRISSSSCFYQLFLFPKTPIFGYTYKKSVPGHLSDWYACEGKVSHSHLFSRWKINVRVASMNLERRVGASQPLWWVRLFTDSLMPTRAASEGGGTARNV